MTQAKPVENFRVGNVEMADTSIVVGDEVISYDFEARDDCYVRGRVELIDFSFGCQRYFIRAMFSASGEGEKPVNWDVSVVKPPVNGTPVAGSDLFTNGVRKV